MYHYCSYNVFPTKTKLLRISDTVEFRYHFITTLAVSPEDKVIDAISQLKKELASIPSPNSTDQIAAIKQMQLLFTQYKNNTTTIAEDQSVKNINTSLKRQPFQRPAYVQISKPTVPPPRVLIIHNNNNTNPLIVSRTRFKLMSNIQQSQ